MLFIGKALLPLTIVSSQTLFQVTEKSISNDNQPIILAGDFNVNFALPQAQPLFEFFENIVL